jgi:malate dehydrogenase (oxaloacetate-decarboxylating)(NADP+)
VKERAGIEKIGPILMGLKHPVNVLQLGSSTREIVNMVAISTLGAG